eukprot:669278-Prorocentrum_lima.AAC.1
MVSMADVIWHLEQAERIARQGGSVPLLIPVAIGQSPACDERSHPLHPLQRYCAECGKKSWL